MGSKSNKTRKRVPDYNEDFMGYVETTPVKKRKLHESESEKKRKSKSEISSPLTRSRTSNPDKSRTPVEKEKHVKEKEKGKENEFLKRNKRSVKSSSRSPDKVLKNVKVLNSNKVAYLNSDSESSSNECEKNNGDAVIVSTPKRNRCRKSLREIYNGISDSPDKVKEKSSKKKVNEENGQHTPSSKKITVNTPTTPLEKARTSLHVSAVPTSLPCREREFKNIFSFLENKLLDGIGGCMYISGVPGTGKTATVTQVINKLKGMAHEGLVPEFKFIEINGMRLADPRQAYVLLWQGLSGKKDRLSAECAQRKLDAWFGKRDPKELKMPTVLLVDELDLICTKKQDVVYNLLDWPTKSPSRLIVLTIANTMDMPERLFKGRVTSRMGLTRLTFMPYTYKQLEEIIFTRLSGLDAFSVDAVRLVTRKVAAVSGDARRSLDICRRATELPAPDETVKISHIEQAIREMTNSNSVKVIRSCSQMEKLFLRSVSEVSTRCGVEEVDMRDVIEHFLALSTLEGLPRLPVSHILNISNRLKCFRLLFVNHPQNGILQRLTLNVSQDDIHYGIKCDA